MCCLFGLLDYKDSLTPRQRVRMLSILATACEARGTDATGIAYTTCGRLVTYKRPRAAHKMHFRLPEDASFVMGHTRMTTQGSEKRNYNNHPFVGRVNDTAFALAHNGILHNDEELQKALHLPKTKIRTDSYVAVQLLEQEKELSFDSIARAVERLEGSFTFTILDEDNNLYIIKGNNPMCLYHYEKLGIYLYASTEEILKKALTHMPFDLGKADKVEIGEGEICKINRYGERSSTTFSLEKLYCQSYYGYPYLWDDDYGLGGREEQFSYLQMLKSMAKHFGYCEEDVEALLREGFSYDEIEEMFYEGAMCY